MRRCRHLPRALLVAALVVASATGVPTTAGAQSPSDSLAQSSIVRRHKRYPAVAATLGIIPGAGHLYAGEYGRGLAIMGGIAGVALATAFIAVGDCIGEDASVESCEDDNVLTAGSVLMLGIWGWSIADAWMAANRANRRAAAASKLAQLARVPVTVHLSRRLTASGEEVRAVNVGVRFSVR